MSAAQAKNFNLLGGRLCLDFANTVGNHASAQPYEHLTGYADLTAWAQQAGALGEREKRALARAAARQPAEAEATFERAKALREAIYRIFSAVAHESEPARADLALLNEELAQALAHARVVPAEEGFVYAWDEERDALDRLLWPVARSAAELLVSAELNRVRECSDEICGWLFLDMSKNRSRRWCDMRDCGNQAKARRHYARQRTAPAAGRG